MARFAPHEMEPRSEGAVALLHSSIGAKKSVDDIWPVAGKRVLIRVDFNVPVRAGVIDNDFKIRAALPTIRRVLDQGGIVILLSHLGRPQGVDSDAADAEHRKRIIAHHFQDNRGKTAFFAELSGEDKAMILSWSSKKDKAASLPAHRGSGKTAVFSRLPEDEKRSLLARFLQENKERAFPQLNSVAGYEEEYSLQIVAIRLAELLGQHVYFAHDCLYAKQETMKLRNGEIMLLENVRFYSNENSTVEVKRYKMAKVLASYGDIYVSDAFGTAHRDSATMTGIPKIMGGGYAGYLMEKEINYFAKVLNNPPRPLVAIVGGAKVSDKIGLTESLMSRIDSLIIGGAMAYTFLKAQGHAIGTSMCEQDKLDLAKSLLQKAAERKVEVLLPTDHVCNKEFKPATTPLVTDGVDIPEGYMALDIGPKTIKRYTDVIAKCKSAIWNGPMGVFEMPCYSKGTFAIAKAMGDSTRDAGLLSVVGGRDTANAVEKAGETAALSHVSTGGVASLELLEGKTLPGIAVLDDKE